MPNVNAPAQLAAFAKQNDLDLTPYREALERVKPMQSASFPGTTWDVEAPFANSVLARLHTNMSLTEAIDGAVEEAKSRIGPAAT